MTASFRGFPPEALEFLRDLEADNDRDWFKANRSRYDDHLVAPARALAGELGALGRPHLFRPWNDTRFHPGPPVKEHLGMTLGYEARAGTTSSCRWTASWSAPGCTRRRPTSSTGCAAGSTERAPPPR